jgi:glyoxylase-like metal-dependent hydrolase (beta-lactamase superfamily II)
MECLGNNFGRGTMQSPRWKVGDVEIYQLIEIEAGEIIQTIIEGATPEAIRSISWLQPHFANADGSLRALVQSFLIKSAGRNILIDTCVGNDKARAEVPEWSDLSTSFLKGLDEIGVTPSDVDVVACTHLHMDHVGWNTCLRDGAWVPTFPNAEYLFAAEEYHYWHGVPEKEIADDHAAFSDSVTPIVEAGIARFVDSDHRIDAHVEFMPTPGHTPAHVSVVVEADGASAIISGDALHHPCQMAYPDWSTESDTFPDQARETRHKLLSELAGTDTLLVGSHFAGPVAGTVTRSEDGFRLLPLG